MSDTVTCPIHNSPLRPEPTKFGTRWACPVQGCTVVWWGRENTTPADKELRDARIAAHAAFDALWSDRKAVMMRGEAYEWLQQTMGLSPDAAHIGLFTKPQCEDLIYTIRRWMGKDRQRLKSKRSKYPRTMPPERFCAGTYLVEYGRCETCRDGFEKGEMAISQTTQNGPTRGDDDVLFWHERCYPKKGDNDEQRPDDPPESQQEGSSQAP